MFWLRLWPVEVIVVEIILESGVAVGRMLNQDSYNY